MSDELVQRISLSFPTEKWSSLRTLVAVSGGPDSVALLRLLASAAPQSPNFLKQNLLVGHVNHHLRGVESQKDAKFVAGLSAELGLAFHETESFNKSPGRHNLLDASEESLRNFRYDKLLEMANVLGARYLVTGHNFDDQVETILFRIFRGTGISGLAGIPRLRLASDSVTIVRPMLDIKRSEIESYLDSIGQIYRTDQSNKESKYARNYLRNELLPKIKTRFGDASTDSIARLGSQAAEVDSYLDRQATVLMRAVMVRDPDNVTIDCQKLDCSELVLLRQFVVRIWKLQSWPLQAMSFSWLEKISREMLAASQPENQTKTASVQNLPNSIRFQIQDRFATFVQTK
ncbi:MAG: tRNA lysidine(34) synthetase TilS [Mariniblastus sp.]